MDEQQTAWWRTQQQREAAALLNVREPATMSDAVSRGKPVLATIEAARIAAYLINGNDGVRRADAFLVALLDNYGVPPPPPPLRSELLDAALRERVERGQ